MNWYKKAQKSQKEDESFANWWYERTRGLQNTRTVQFLLSQNDVTIEQLKGFLSAFPDKSNIGLLDAIKSAGEHYKKQREKKTQEKMEKHKAKYMREIEDETTIRKNLVGKDCFLNGYPAKIEENKLEEPVIVSPYSYTGDTNGNSTDYSKSFLPTRNWINTQKYFPHFYGGIIYNLSDTEDVVTQRIEKEKRRPYYPTQPDVLRILKEREKSMIERSTKFTFKKNDPSQTTKNRFRSYSDPLMPVNEYVKKRETGRIPNELV